MHRCRVTDGIENIESVSFLFLLSKNAKIKIATRIISMTLTLRRELYLLLQR